MFRVSLLIAVLCSFVAAAPITTPEKRPPPAPQLLTLATCVDIALRNNLGLAVRRVATASAYEEVEIARAFFEPEFVAAAGRSFRAGDVALRDNSVNTFRAAVATKLPSGATLEVGADLARTEFGHSPEIFTSDLAATLRQPLLRDAGFYINRLPITLGKIGVSQADSETRRTLLDLLRNVETAWWSLVFAHREKDIAARSLSLAQRLVDEAKARVKVGLAADVDVLQANTSLASRREALINAGQEIEDRMDELLLLMGKLGEEEYLVALPAHLPVLRVRTIPTAEALQLVHALPEYHIQIDEIRQRRLLVDKARNDALPVVDIGGGVGYNGAGGNAGEAFDRGFHNREDWQVLLEMRIPLGFRAERAQVRRAKNALEIEDLRRTELEQSLHAQIREAVRALSAGLERIKVTEASVRLSDEQYDALLARFTEGLTSFREMENAQEDLQEARLRALVAQREAIRAAIRLARLDGTLLSRFGLAWEVGK